MSARKKPSTRRGAINEWHRARKLAEKAERNGTLEDRVRQVREALTEPLTVKELTARLGFTSSGVAQALVELRSNGEARKGRTRWEPLPPRQTVKSVVPDESPRVL